MSHVLSRIHNPRGRTCGCAPECWCQSSRLGRAVRWWVPAHRHTPVDAGWKREQAES